MRRLASSGLGGDLGAELRHGAADFAPNRKDFEHKGRPEHLLWVHVHFKNCRLTPPKDTSHLSSSPTRRSAVSPTRFSTVGHVASHGLMSVRPQPSNPLMSRVTTLALWHRATEAIMRSTVAVGRPARLRAAKISA